MFYLLHFKSVKTPEWKIGTIKNEKVKGLEQGSANYCHRSKPVKGPVL